MIRLLQSGGIVMAAIFLCGIFSIFVAANRLWFFAFTKRREKKFYAQSEILLQKKDFDSLKNFCRTEFPAEKCTAEIIEKFFLRKKNSVQQSGEKIDEKKLRDFAELQIDFFSAEYDKGISFLGTVSHAATLLGLLGTVLGNIRAFGVLSGGDFGNAELLSGAVGESLITTVAGLCVAIPSSIFENLFFSFSSKRILFFRKFVFDFFCGTER